MKLGTKLWLSFGAMTALLALLVCAGMLAFLQTIDALSDQLRAYGGPYARDIGQALAPAIERYSIMIYLYAGGILSFVVCSAGAAYWMFRRLLTGIGRITAAMDGIAGGDAERTPRLPVRTDDGLGRLAESYNRMADSLEKRISDVRDRQRSLEEREWRSTKVTEFAVLLRGSDSDDARAIAESFLRKLAPAAGAGSGAIYALSSMEQERPPLNKLASYAGGGEDAGCERIGHGEGLVGECALQNKTIVLDDVPPTHLRIRSGLGRSEPSSLLLIPVPFGGRAIAVLELASHGAFDRSRIGLFKQLCGMLGASLHNAIALRDIREALAEARRESERLRASNGELQKRQEELQQTLSGRREQRYNEAEGVDRERTKVRTAPQAHGLLATPDYAYRNEFLANVSHELRTPLNSLLLLAQLLYDNKQGNLLPKQLEYVRTIHAAGMELLRLIDEILDLSKITSGNMELAEDLLAVSDLAADLEQRFRPSALQKRLYLRFDMRDDTMRAMMRIDTQKLRQALSNLISNAIKFTERGGVTVTFRRDGDGEASGNAGEDERESAFGRRAGQASLLIEVSDTGIGIPREKQEMIFESFRQADGSTSRKYGGTGLGLSISKELAALLGGTIRLESVEGEGSTFALCLPVRLVDGQPSGGERDYAETPIPSEPLPNAIDAAERRTDDVRRFDNRTILLVDDDMRSIFALAGVLESYGMRVLFAENELEALNMLKRFPDIDLVLMDMMMPQMNGYEALRSIRRAEERWRDLPIIALSAKAMEDDRAKCMEAGASDYIGKPVRYGQLLALLRAMLR